MSETSTKRIIDNYCKALKANAIEIVSTANSGENCYNVLAEFDRLTNAFRSLLEDMCK